MTRTTTLTFTRTVPALSRPSGRPGLPPPPAPSGPPPPRPSPSSSSRPTRPGGREISLCKVQGNPTSAAKPAGSTSSPPTAA